MKRFVTLLSSAWISSFLLAQGVGVNETGADPHPSAILDVSSTSKGFAPPRMTTEQRDLIEDPMEGLQIYNLSTKCVEVFYGTFWQSIHCGCSSGPADLFYTDNGPLSYCLNQNIGLNNAITQGGNPSLFTVSPTLPPGLQINSANGQITGTPTSTSAPADYTVTASNACGSATRMLQIGVISTPDTPAAITGDAAPTVSLTATYSIESVSGATSYTWGVPDGWAINSVQGMTSIYVTVGIASGNISVTATNACGTSAASDKAVIPWRPTEATGGTITTYTADGSNGINGVQYRVHSFTTAGSSSLIVTDDGTNGQVDYLIVGGGGGGGSRHGGAGGAGGMLSGSISITPVSFPVVVGNGGVGGIGNSSLPLSGGNSSVFGFTAIGGGGGGQYSETGSFRRDNGLSGGSGGGGANNASPLTPGQGGLGTSDQGNNGGNVITAGGQWASAGGGGAGSAGGNSPNTTTSGAGGAGLSSSINGTAIHYAGGGGGGGNDSSGTGGAGGIGGGGNGGGGDQPGGNGANGLGGGGGGARASTCFSCAPGGSGGSGVVIIRYPITNPNP